MQKRWLYALCLLGLMKFSVAQEISITPVYTKDSLFTIYSFKLHNTSTDSIVVLHAQVFVEPPFINEYAQQSELTATGRIYKVQIGKSNNPRMPERYQAIRAVVPNDTLELFFRAETHTQDRRMGELYITLLDEKYLRDFQRINQVPSTKDIARCKMLKEKHGKVKHFVVAF
jgi:hypothetical protein